MAVAGNAIRMTVEQPVLIIGAGVGGLVLAHALRKKSVPFRIFERDPKLDYRPQGYRFHLRKQGEEALLGCLCLSTAQQLMLSSPSTPTSHLLCDPFTGQQDEAMLKIAMAMKPDSDYKPMSLDRNTLRATLAHPLPIEYGKKFKSYSIDEEGIIVHFHDNTSATGSLLVGADGVRSAVRASLLPDYSILDTQGRWIWGKSDLTPELRSRLHPELANNGILFSQDKSYNGSPVTLLAEAIMFDRSPENPHREKLPQDYIYWVLQFSTRTARIDDASFLNLNSEGAAGLAQHLTGQWDPRVRAIFEHHNAVDVAAQLVTSADPNFPEYDGQGRIVLLGDALHHMPPTAGVGATSAIQDAKWLADALGSGVVNKESLAAYEWQMKKNGAEGILSAEPKLAKMFGGASSLAHMRRLTPDMRPVYDNGTGDGVQACL